MFFIGFAVASVACMASMACGASVSEKFVCPTDWKSNKINAYPNSHNIFRYWVCSSKGPVAFLCPPYTLFNEKMNSCSSYIFQCPSTYTKDSTYENKAAPHTFWKCGQSGARLLHCPIGSGYDSKLMYCVKPGSDVNVVNNKVAQISDKAQHCNHCPEDWSKDLTKKYTATSKQECRGYCECIDNTPHYHQCPNDEVFHRKRNRCVPGPNMECMLEVPPKPTGPASSDKTNWGLIPKGLKHKCNKCPADWEKAAINKFAAVEGVECLGYCSCSIKDNEPRPGFSTCDFGQLFDAATSKCMPKDKVKCPAAPVEPAAPAEPAKK